MSTWSRDKALLEVRDRLWRYLSESAQPEALPYAIEELFRLPRGEVRRLSSVYLALSPLTEEMLESVKQILPELASSVERAEIELLGRVRGQVAWTKTQTRRIATADPTRFVCRTAERRYDTPLARLVLMALVQCVELERLTGLSPTSRVGLTVSDRVVTSKRLLRHPKLSEVTLVHFLPERVLTALARHRHAAPIVRFVRAFRDGVRELSLSALSDVLNEMLLTPATDDRLFELQVGFGIVDALYSIGFSDASVRLIVGASVPLARLSMKGETLDVWWQKSLWKLPEYAGQAGSFREVCETAGITPSTLRPDLLVRVPGERVLLVEVKLRSKDGDSGERDGIRDVLAYLDDARSVLDSLPMPHALVVANAAAGRPNDGRVMVSDIEHVGMAVEIAFGA